MWRAILLAAAVFALSVADAAADTAYGGGYLHSLRERAQAFTVSAFHDEARSVVRVRVDGGLRCKPPGVDVDFVGEVPVTEGAGTATGRRTLPLLTGRVRLRWAVSIRLEGARATGTVTMTGTERYRGRTYR